MFISVVFIHKHCSLSPVGTHVYNSLEKEVMMSRAYIVKTMDKDSGEPIPGVFEELQVGRARIGWSYRDDLDLRLIQEKIQQGSSLNGYEQDAKRCLGFLARPTLDDYLLYPHQPDRGQFCIVQVKDEYDYSAAEDGLDGDFRSFRPCSLMTSGPVDMYDEIVPSQLRQRLGRPGRFSEVYDTSPLFIFLEALPEAGRIQDASNRAGLQRIHNELREKLPDALRREFSRADLSRKLCPDLFERMGYSYVVQEGPAEAGSDIVVSLGSPLLLDSVEIRIGVQVFASEGTVEKPYFSEGDQNMATSIQLPADAEQRLDFLAAQTGRTKDVCLREIIERGLEDMEDYYIAAEVLKRVRNGEEQVYSAVEVKKSLGLNN